MVALEINPSTLRSVTRQFAVGAMMLLRSAAQESTVLPELQEGDGFLDGEVGDFMNVFDLNLMENHFARLLGPDSNSKGNRSLGESVDRWILHIHAGTPRSVQVFGRASSEGSSIRNLVRRSSLFRRDCRSCLSRRQIGRVAGCFEHSKFGHLLVSDAAGDSISIAGGHGTHRVLEVSVDEVFGNNRLIDQARTDSLDLGCKSQHLQELGVVQVEVRINSD